ncbi:hypothetical protein C8R45DRAFT_933106 [Mycena sanguinolenta]|nr:hypothetical protein C8R45DRAFT_933106 [Mycena sanguinolenta]
MYTDIGYLVDLYEAPLSEPAPRHGVLAGGLRSRFPPEDERLREVCAHEVGPERRPCDFDLRPRNAHVVLQECDCHVEHLRRVGDVQGPGRDDRDEHAWKGTSAGTEGEEHGKVALEELLTMRIVFQKCSGKQKQRSVHAALTRMVWLGCARNEQLSDGVLHGRGALAQGGDEDGGGERSGALEVNGGELADGADLALLAEHALAHEVSQQCHDKCAHEQALVPRGRGPMMISVGRDIEVEYPDARLACQRRLDERRLGGFACTDSNGGALILLGRVKIKMNFFPNSPRAKRKEKPALSPIRAQVTGRIRCQFARVMHKENQSKDTERETEDPAAASTNITTAGSFDYATAVAWGPSHRRTRTRGRAHSVEYSTLESEPKGLMSPISSMTRLEALVGLQAHPHRVGLRIRRTQCRGATAALYRHFEPREYNPICDLCVLYMKDEPGPMSYMPVTGRVETMYALVLISPARRVFRQVSAHSSPKTRPFAISYLRLNRWASARPGSSRDATIAISRLRSLRSSQLFKQQSDSARAWITREARDLETRRRIGVEVKAIWRAPPAPDRFDSHRENIMARFPVRAAPNLLHAATGLRSSTVACGGSCGRTHRHYMRATPERSTSAPATRASAPWRRDRAVWRWKGYCVRTSLFVSTVPPWPTVIPRVWRRDAGAGQHQHGDALRVRYLNRTNLPPLTHPANTASSRARSAPPQVEQDIQRRWCEAGGCIDLAPARKCGGARLGRAGKTSTV